MDKSGEPQTETEGAQYIRLPWPLVAAAIFVFLMLLLGLGLYARGTFRPSPAVTPILAAAAPTSVSTPTAVAAVPPTQGPTPLILVTVASPTATAQPAAVASTSTSPPSSPMAPTALPTVEPALADEVGRAYVAFWRVRSQSTLELDSARLADVMDGDYLTAFEARLGDLRREGHAIKTRVTLNYTVVQVTVAEAIVHDRVEDESVYVDLNSKEPLTSPTNGVALVEFKLRKFNETWKVVDSVKAL